MHLSVSLTATYEKVMLYGFAEKESWFYKACNSKNPSLDTRQPVHNYLGALGSTILPG